ncbi:MAG: hypothetical protein RIR70_652 [Pseudomonadota bacterium]|jgi:glycerol-3-phosphate acyltransferase PlsY
MPSLISVAVLGYLMGSVPFAIIVSRLFGIADPRSYGSHNPGATNVLRSGHKLAALLTLLGDALKGSAAVLIAQALYPAHPAAPAIAGLAAFIGHLFPIFLRGKGGKGVATAAGVLMAISPLLGAGVFVVWAGMAKLFRYSSLAAISAAISAPLTALWLLGADTRLACITLMSTLIIWRHRENIRRLIAGTESRIGKKGA